MKSLKENKQIQYFQTEFKPIPCEKALSDEAKSASSGTIISGYASTPTVDRYNDIVEPGAFSASIVNNYKKNPIILFQHDPMQPIGKATYMSIDSNGLYIEALIVDDDIEPKIKAGILRAFSIGYIPKTIEYRSKDGTILNEKDDLMEIFFSDGIQRIIKDLDLVENSIVSIPANPDALFTMQKSLNKYFKEEASQKFFKETEDAIIVLGMKDEEGKQLSFGKDKWTMESVKKHLEDQYKANQLNKKNMDKNLLNKKEGEIEKPVEVKPEEVKPEEVKPEEVKPEEVKPETTPEKPEDKKDDVTKTDDSEKPVESEGGEKNTDGKVEPEKKPEEGEGEGKQYILADIATKAVAKVLAENEALLKKNKELEDKLARTPVKQARIYSEHQRLAPNAQGANDPEKKPEQKSGFKDAFVGAAN